MFKVPPITKNLIIINILVFVATGLVGRNGTDLTDVFGLHFFLSDSFMPHQLLTYMFMHASFEHIFFNMLAFWMFGRILEQVWGPRRYVIFYMVCGVGAGLCQELVQYIDYMRQGLADYDMVKVGNDVISKGQFLNFWTTVGASGAVYGILLGFGMTFPNERVMLLIPPIPLKAKYLIMGYVGIELVLALNMSNSNVAHFAHLGGMLFGFLLILYWRHKAGVNRKGFSTWREYRPQKESLWGRLKKKTQRKPRRQASATASASSPRHTASSHDPMAERRAQQAEIDRILDKVKKSGYGCLTEQEKKTIFDFRNN